MKGFKVGDAVGVGYFLDSCLTCKQCLAGNEQKCTKTFTVTYQEKDKHGRAAVYPPDSVSVGKIEYWSMTHSFRKTLWCSEQIAFNAIILYESPTFPPLIRRIYIQDDSALPIRYPHPTFLSH